MQGGGEKYVKTEVLAEKKVAKEVGFQGKKQWQMGILVPWVDSIKYIVLPKISFSLLQNMPGNMFPAISSTKLSFKLMTSVRSVTIWKHFRVKNGRVLDGKVVCGNSVAACSNHEEVYICDTFTSMVLIESLRSILDQGVARYGKFG